MDATRCAVRAVRVVGPDALAIDVETPPEFDARPGQFVKVTVDLVAALGPEKVREMAERGILEADEVDVTDPTAVEEGDVVEVSRFYTVSSPTVEDTFEMTVEIDPEGTFGPVLEGIEPGDELLVTGPFGTDYYEGEPSVLVLAGGPGIGPALAIAERALGTDSEAAVVYRDDEPIYADRIEDVRAAGATVELVDGNGDLSGPVADALAAVGTDAQVFVYGFADFVDAATTAVEAAGGDAATAKIENFG